MFFTRVDCAALDLYCEILTMYERHYPEILNRNYIINGMLIGLIELIVLSTQKTIQLLLLQQQKVNRSFSAAF